jgi:hypothetical protein
MGSGICNCCSDNRGPSHEFTMSHPNTARLDFLIAMANSDLAQTDFFCAHEPKLDYGESNSTTPNPHRKSPSKSSIYANKRVLSTEELTKIDLKSLFSQGDMSSIDLTVVVPGVSCCPEDIFQLEDGRIYKGEFDELGCPHGRGVQLSSDGAKFVGFFSHGHAEGAGRLVTAKGVILQGPFRYCGNELTKGLDSVLDGAGLEIWPNGARYKGEFRMGVKDGKGTLEVANFKYHGLFKEDLMHGKGVMTWRDGKKFKGEWRGLCMDRERFSGPMGKAILEGIGVGKNMALGL